MMEFNPVDVVRAAPERALKRTAEIIMNTLRIECLTHYYAKELVYGHNKVYGKRGKHRRGTYVPKCFNSRFSAKRINKSIVSMERVVTPDQWGRRDLLICLKRDEK